MSQYIARTYGGLTMYEAQYATTPPMKHERWYTCHLCGFDYPESKVILKGGATFCLPEKCYTDIDSQRTGGQI